jgi:hypothetical protein
LKACGLFAKIQPDFWINRVTVVDMAGQGKEVQTYGEVHFMSVFYAFYAHSGQGSGLWNGAGADCNMFCDKVLSLFCLSGTAFVMYTT